MKETGLNTVINDNMNDLFKEFDKNGDGINWADRNLDL